MFIFSNLATSVDGKIATASRVHFPLGTPADREQMQVLRRRADAILMGASTVRAFRKPCLVYRKGGMPRTLARRQALNIMVSSSLNGMDPTWPFFTEAPRRPLVIHTARIPAARRRAFERHADLVRIDKSGRGIAGAIVRELEGRGIRKLLVEGGGGVMWDFAAEDLLDELNITVTPWVIGGAAAPTLVDGAGFEPADAQRLRLKSCRKIKDELFLVYARRRPSQGSRKSP